MTTKLDLRLIKDIAANTVLGADALGSPAAKTIGGNLSFVGGVLYGQKSKYEHVSISTLSGQANSVQSLNIDSEHMGNEFELQGLTPSADANLAFEFSTDGGATYLATNIANYVQATGTTTAGATGVTVPTFIMNYQAAVTVESTSFGLSGTLRITQPNTTKEAVITYLGSYVDNGGARRYGFHSGQILVNVPITHIRLIPSAGNLAAGTIIKSKIRKAA